MRRSFEGALGALLLAAHPAAAQTPFPKYDEARAYLMTRTPSELAAEIVPNLPSADFDRAGVIKPHPAPWGEIMLWTKSEVVEVRATGPVAAVCKREYIYATLRALAPVRYSEPTRTTVYKPLFREELGQREPNTACAGLDPRKFDTAPDAPVLADAMTALSPLLDAPKTARITWVTGCLFASACAVTRDDFREAINVSVGPCPDMVAEMIRDSALRARLGAGLCYRVTRSSMPGFRVHFRADVEHSEYLAVQFMTTGYSESVMR